mmetsp:Transcript_8604/g.13941  ORF Transcript_8604/g.13941 Transcript_8604/m.13941 type:complete len:208 (+) Transcript_8604:163-786(+)
MPCFWKKGMACMLSSATSCLAKNPPTTSASTPCDNKNSRASTLDCRLVGAFLLDFGGVPERNAEERNWLQGLADRPRRSSTKAAISRNQACPLEPFLGGDPGSSLRLQLRRAVGRNFGDSMPNTQSCRLEPGLGNDSRLSSKRLRRVTEECLMGRSNLTMACAVLARVPDLGRGCAKFADMMPLALSQIIGGKATKLISILPFLRYT